MLNTIGLLLALLLATESLTPATLVRGIVRDTSGEALPGVTVFVKGSQQSVVSDAAGAFELSVSEPVTIVWFLGGFDSHEEAVVPPAQIDVRLALSKISDSVTVTARVDRDAPMSTFDRGPLDIVRTPGAQGDVFRALQQLPGVVKTDEGAGLFVRGGDVSELRVFLDGATIAHPYRFESSTGGQFGAVEPFLLQGLAFSTGGFSARYGNALSAILDLRGLGRPQSTTYTATAGLAGLSGRVSLPQGESSGIRASGNFRFPRLLFAVNGNPREFDRYPGGWDLNFSTHHESPALGRLKVFAMEQRTSVGVQLERESFDGFLHSTTRHEVVAANWKKVAGAWQLTSSAGADLYANETDVGVLDLKNRDRRMSWRFDAARAIGSILLRTGVDADSAKHGVTGRTPLRGGDYAGVAGVRDFDVDYRDTHAGVYAEGEGTWGRVTGVVGLRADQSDLAGSWLDPRLNLTYAMAGHQQLRFAWGIYHQAPASQYFDRVAGEFDLAPMRAEHWIVGYEIGDPDQPLHVRVEAYAKDYDDLPLERPTGGFTSDGHGFARGVDTFVRKTWEKLELRGSYSYLDAQRRWTPHEQRQRYVIPDGTWRPDFAVPHGLELALSGTPTPKLTLGAAWHVSSGRPTTPIVGSFLSGEQHVPVYGAINSERLPRYERFDVSGSYRNVAPASAGESGMQVVYFAGVTNVFARENTFEYAYSEDFTVRRPVVSAAPRSVYVGFSITR